MPKKTRTERYYIEALVNSRFIIRDSETFNLPIYSKDGTERLVFDEEHVFAALSCLNDQAKAEKMGVDINDEAYILMQEEKMEQLKHGRKPD